MPAKITFPADSSADLHGYNSGTFRLPVQNSGTVPLQVTGSVAVITSRAKHHPALSWVTVDSGPQTIQPGHTGYLIVRVQVPAGASIDGPRFVNILARTAPVSHTGQVQEAGGVGGTLKITHATHQAPPSGPPVAPVTHGPDGWLWFGILAAAVVASAAAYWVRRARNRRRARQASHGWLAARTGHPAARHARGEAQ